MPETVDRDVPASCALCGEHDVVTNEIDGLEVCRRCQVQCPECDRWVRTDTVCRSNHSDVSCCPDCAVNCANCEDLIPPQEADECERCPDCTIVCNDCGGLIGTGEACSSPTGDETLCEECYNATYRECRECGDIYELLEINGDGICTGCSTDAPSEDDIETLHDFGYRPAPNYLYAPNEAKAPIRKRVVFYGVEVETEAPNSRDRGADADEVLGCDNQEWYAKVDGSLIHGIEWVSHPGTLRYWREASSFFSALRDKGYLAYKTTTCGMHVHVSRAALSKLTLYRLLEFVRLNEWFMVQVSRRQPEAFRRWAKVDARGSNASVHKAQRHYDNPDRYEAINCTGESTIEFRIFRSTLNEDSFKRNLFFVAALVEFARVASSIRLTKEDFVAWIRDEGCRFLGGSWSNKLATWLEKIDVSAYSSDA